MLKKIIPAILFIFLIGYIASANINTPPEKPTAVQIFKYNTETGKYHYPSCRWAIKCTRNCIDLSLEEIRKRGGTPCKVCKPPR